MLNALMGNMYSDDISIPYSSNSISTINNVANEDLESLKTWLEEKTLSLNVAKKHRILIGSRNIIRSLNQSNTTMPSINIGDDKASPITSVKYLGLQVDQYLREILIDNSKKVPCGIGMLRLARRYLPLEVYK